MYKYLTLGILLMLFGLQGCASIINNRTVEVPIESDPPGVLISANGQTWTTPTTIEVPRGQEHPVELVFTKPGYKAEVVKLEKSYDAWIMGNIIFGALGFAVGYFVDIGTGKGFDVEPEEVHYVMAKTSAEGSGYLIGKGPPTESRKAEPLDGDEDY